MRQKTVSKRHEFMQHLPDCNTVKDWYKEIAEMDKIPVSERDDEWERKRNDLWVESLFCTCGYNYKVDEVKNLSHVNSWFRVVLSDNFADQDFRSIDEAVSKIKEISISKQKEYSEYWMKIAKGCKIFKITEVKEEMNINIEL